MTATDDEKPPATRIIVSESGRMVRVDLKHQKRRSRPPKPPIEDTRVSDAWARDDARNASQEAEREALRAVRGDVRVAHKEIRRRSLTGLESATPERTARGGGEARYGDDRVQRIQDQPLDRLFARKAITERQHDAGDKFRTDFIEGGLLPLSASDPSAARVSSGGDYWGRGFMPTNQRQLHARLRWRDASAALGERLSPVIEEVVIAPLRVSNDEAVTDLALIGMRMFGRKQKDECRTAIIELLKVALDTLADSYEMPGGGYRPRRRHVSNPDGPAQVCEDLWQKPKKP